MSTALSPSYSLVIHTEHDNGATEQFCYLFADSRLDEDPSGDLRAELEETHRSSSRWLLAKSCDRELEFGKSMPAVSITHIYTTYEYLASDE